MKRKPKTIPHKNQNPQIFQMTSFKSCTPHLAEIEIDVYIIYIIYTYKHIYLFILVIHLFTTAQLHWTKPELRFCAGSSPAGGMLEIHDGEDLWQWSQLEIRLNKFRRSTIPQKQFIIIIIIIIIIIMSQKTNKSLIS